jgi:LysR family transcriptional regulator, hypochlorite-specific transcription factor HypT
MKLEWIEDFIALERTRNFTKAAEQRNTTQPAYSRRIVNLEEWFGVPLFLRNTRPIALTPSGKALKLRIHNLRSDIIDIRRIVASAATQLPQATKIYTTNTIAIGVLSEWLLTHGIEKYALIVASVSACLNALDEGKADFALIPNLFENHNIKNSYIVAEDSLVLCHHSDTRIKYDEKNFHHPLLMYSPGTAYGQFILKNLNDRDITLINEPVCESASAEALLSQVKAKRGAAWIPKSIISDKDQLKIIQGFSFPYKILCVHNNQPPNPSPVSVTCPL